MADYTERVVFFPGNPLGLVTPGIGEKPISMEDAAAILASQALGVEALIRKNQLVPECVSSAKSYIDDILDVAVLIGLTELPL